MPKDRASHRLMGCVMSVTLLPVGLAVLLFAAWGTRQEMTFVSSARQAEGRVVSIDATPRRSRLFVEFVAHDGVAHGFSSSVGNPELHSVGERVDVLYDPANPSNAQIRSPLRSWGVPIVAGGIGGLVALTGIAGLLLALRRRDDRPH